MKTKELTVEQVRSELEILIEKYPTRKGSIVTPSEGYYDDDEPSDNDFTCVYYTDENDRPVNTTSYHANDQPVFKTPICIVGQWIEDFHPEFKNEEIVQSFLMRNATISSLYQEENPFTLEVKNLLGTAQNAQDATNAEWKDIDLSDYYDN